MGILSKFSGAGQASKKSGIAGSVEKVAQAVAPMTAGINAKAAANFTDVLTVGNENLDTATVSQLQDYVTSCESIATAAIAALGGDNALTSAQKAAGNYIASIAAAQREGQKPNVAFLGGLEFGHESMKDTTTYANLVQSFEAFDGQLTKNTLSYSIAFNILASRQDEFGESFYPTLTLDPTNAGFEVEVSYAYLIKEFQHKLNGSAITKSTYPKVPLLKNLFNSEYMEGDANKLVPVHRAENASLLLVEGIREDKTTGEAIQTAPIKSGVTASIIGLSMSDKLLDKNAVLDMTDAVDRGAVLTKIVLKLGADMFSFDVTREASRLFVDKQVGGADAHVKETIMNFKSESIILDTAAPKKLNGAASIIFAGLPEAYKIKFNVSLTGELALDTGNISVAATKVEINSIMTSAGVALAPGAEYTAVVTALGTINAQSFLGYDVDAFLTNSNTRMKGMRLTYESQVKKWSCPLKMGVTLQVPVVNAMGTNNDVDKIAQHISAVHIKISYDAVKTLVSYANELKLVTSAEFDTGVVFSDTPTYEIITPTFLDDEFEASKYVDSLRSSQNVEDLQAALGNKIKTMVLAAYISSNYNIVHQSKYGADKRPGVLIGTDPTIASWLSQGNGIDLGKDFTDVKIVSTPNPAMKSKITIVFDPDSSKQAEAFEEMKFGYCLWSPTILVDLQKTLSGGAVAREIHNIPRYKHINLMPVMMELNVVNLNSAFGKHTYNMKTVV